MKGYYKEMPDGRVLDMSPCGTCKYKSRMTIEQPCYDCIDIMDLALHRPNAETEFACYTPEETTEEVNAD